MSRTAIVVTTIFEPAFLRGYLDSLRTAGRETEVAVYVIGDRKTPASVWGACEAARREGFGVECPTLEAQEGYLKQRGVPEGFVPWNTDNRRNIGFLMALEAGCETLISIDDDNYCLPDVDYVGEHLRGLRSVADPVAAGTGGWFNVSSLMECTVPGEVFPRGFPYAAQRELSGRALAPGFSLGRSRERRAAPDAEPGASARPLTAVNAGLWLDDPDVDAVCRLGQRPKFTGWSGRSAVLDAGTWSPINTQNTALTREAALTYYYVRMGYPLRGLSIDRFGDILSGYFTQKCVKHVGQSVRVGSPVVEHRRTVHNLFKDLYHELAGMVLVEDLIPWLRELKLTGSTMLDAYVCLADELAAGADRFQGFIWDDGGRDFLRDTAACMRLWEKTVRRWA